MLIGCTCFAKPSQPSRFFVAMVLSQTAIYSLKATLYLADRQDTGPTRVDEIATALDVPRNYLSKILHVMTRSGLLESMRGPNGGFTLVRSPEGLMLADVVAPFHDIANESGCLLGRDECRDDDPCPAHHRWRSASAALKSFFRETSIADLARDDCSPVI